MLHGEAFRRVTANIWTLNIFVFQIEYWISNMFHGAAFRRVSAKFWILKIEYFILNINHVTWWSLKIEYWTCFMVELLEAYQPIFEHWIFLYFKLNIEYWTFSMVKLLEEYQPRFENWTLKNSYWILNMLHGEAFRRVSAKIWILNIEKFILNIEHVTWRSF